MEQNPSSGKKKLAFVVEDGVVGEDRQSPSGDGAGKPFAFLDRRAKCYSAWEEGVFFRDGDEVRLDLGGGGEGGRGPLGAGGEGEGVEGGGDIAGGSWGGVNTGQRGEEGRKIYIPGYWFRCQVPPSSASRSKMRMSVMLCLSFRVAPRPMPEKPAPMQANWV